MAKPAQKPILWISEASDGIINIHKIERGLIIQF